MKLIIGFLSGILAAMGFGGGSVLLIYLTTFSGVEQVKAQGINLLFFIPCAFVSVIYNFKKGLIKYKNGIFIFLGSLFGMIIGIYLLRFVQGELLGKLFGAFLIISGISSLIKLK